MAKRRKRKASTARRVSLAGRARDAHGRLLPATGRSHSLTPVATHRAPEAIVVDVQYVWDSKGYDLDAQDSPDGNEYDPARIFPRYEPFTTKSAAMKFAHVFAKKLMQMTGAKQYEIYYSKDRKNTDLVYKS